MTQQNLKFKCNIYYVIRTAYDIVKHYLRMQLVFVIRAAYDTLLMTNIISIKYRISDSDLSLRSEDSYMIYVIRTTYDTRTAYELISSYVTFFVIRTAYDI